MTLAAVANHYGITLTDVRDLRAWELKVLIKEMGKARRAADRKRQR